MERMQKTLAEVKGCPQKDRTESEGYVGVQTFMWICEEVLVVNLESTIHSIQVLDPYFLKCYPAPSVSALYPIIIHARTLD